MTPLTPAQVAAIQAVKSVSAQLLVAWPSGGSPGYVLSTEIQANLLAFYEGVLGIGQAKKG